VVRSPERLEEVLHEPLVSNQRRLGVHPVAPGVAGCFAELIIRSQEASGQRVVILVDESRSSCTAGRPRRSGVRMVRQPP
jgi:hypothetical protein